MYEGYGGGAGGSDEDGLVGEWSSGSSEAYYSCGDSSSRGSMGAASEEQLQGLRETREERYWAAREEERRMREREAEEGERARRERAGVVRKEVEERDRRVREELVRGREEAAVQQRVRRERAIRKKVRAIDALRQLGRPLTLEEQEKVAGLEGLELELGQLGRDERVGGTQAAVGGGVSDEVMMMRKVGALNRELVMSQERVKELVRSEEERVERKRRAEERERRHKERIRQVPEWQRRGWARMERWLEESRGEEGQEEMRQMREEVEELRVVRRVLEVELALVEAAGRCVESVSEGVQCGWGSVGWGRQTSRLTHRS